ncbi:Lon protease family protein [Insolitispirillum peregrinum]|uniref:Lon protease family protein n=1 Tax=Insolitispirillum peregrinum TaxID=80876 RepID=UPI00361581C4
MTFAPVAPLAAEHLYHVVDPALLPYQRSDQAEAITHPVGQSRAVEAVRFGLGMTGEGYNLFCMGPEGTGKASLVRSFVTAAAAQRSQPEDWCYVHNFTTPEKPRALALPAGTARAFAKAMDCLIEELRHAIPAAFDSDQYRARRRAIEDEFKARQEALIDAHRDTAKGRDIALMRTPMGLALAPIHDGEVVSADDFANLPEEQQAEWKARMQGLQDELENALRQVPRWEREKREQVRTLNKETADAAVSHLIDDLQQDYDSASPAAAYLRAVHDDVLENVGAFLPDGDDDKNNPMLKAANEDGPFRRYKINVLVSHDDSTGAPVIEEDHPIQPNLVGRIEHRQQFGALVTDFNLIRAGALHRANGGFLILEARKLLTQPFAWDDLKRALRKREITIEAPGSSWGMWSTQALEPEAIPLDVKVILLGEPSLFYLLSEMDADFRELFKVVADFDVDMPREQQTLHDLALLLADMARRKNLRPLGADAVARVIEYSSRLSEDREKLSTNMGELADLLREGDYMAAQAGASLVSAEHIRAAIRGRERRADRIPLAMQEEMEHHTIRIVTDGDAIGEINGLAILEAGPTIFGKPSRISTRVRMGRGELIDIEREAELSGPLHSKGVMILSSFLASRFAEDQPLPIHATIVFEQSYGMIDGDSASSTELYALMSALSGMPIRQSLAVTGSVDQFGRIQAIGGVNEKIEGFFDLCQARGLTGQQGVLIPASNVRHLMLREDIVDACGKGLFHIYPVETIDQGIELLTGVEAGTLSASGEWTLGSINRAIAAKLSLWARKQRELDAGGDGRRRDK